MHTFNLLRLFNLFDISMLSDRRMNKAILILTKIFSTTIRRYYIASKSNFQWCKTPNMSVFYLARCLAHSILLLNGSIVLCSLWYAIILLNYFLFLTVCLLLLCYTIVLIFSFYWIAPFFFSFFYFFFLLFSTLIILQATNWSKFGILLLL